MGKWKKINDFLWMKEEDGFVHTKEKTNGNVSIYAVPSEVFKDQMRWGKENGF